MKVSVLIPAFRTTFLAQAIASVLAQNHKDFELIISDDSGADEVHAVVKQFRDTRIQYNTTSGRTGARENVLNLWNRAQFDLIKYLLDDDLLLPNALSEMIAQISITPNFSFMFGHRYIIDEHGKVLDEPKPVKSEYVQLDRPRMSQLLVGRVKNSIGEFSNIMINRASGVIAEDFMSYMGQRLHVNGDVAFFLTAAGRAPAVGISRTLSAFRRHQSQLSSPAFNPSFALGICEWELFIRGEYAAGSLSSSVALAAVDKLQTAYTTWSATLPAIGRMKAGLARLRTRVEAGDRDVFDESFLEDWNGLVAMVTQAHHTNSDV